MTYLDHPIVTKLAKVPDCTEVVLVWCVRDFFDNPSSIGRQQPPDRRHFCPAATD